LFHDGEITISKGEGKSEKGTGKKEKRKEKREKRKKEDAMKRKFFNYLTDFGLGIVVGFLLAAIIFGIVFGVMLHRQKIKEVTEYAEKQNELQILQEDYINRDPVEFLEIPGVRGAADSAAAEFERRRDEILHGFRDRLVRRADLVD